MSVFTRMKDIVSANINAMLDSAQNPAKMAALMVSEIEDTAVEIKRNTANLMAHRKLAAKAAADARARAKSWEERARLAITKGRDDLAREALVRKRAELEQAIAQEQELGKFDELIAQHKKDLVDLDATLQKLRERRRELDHERQVARQTQSSGGAGRPLFRADSPDYSARIEAIERRIGLEEAELELFAPSADLELDRKFKELEQSAAIEKELTELKANME